MTTTGSTSRKVRYARTTTRRPQRAARLSVTAGHPSLDDVEGDEPQERAHEQARGAGSGPGDAVLLDFSVDEDRRNLRLARQVAGDQHRRAELAQRAGERERGAGRHGRRDRRQDDAPEDRELA